MGRPGSKERSAPRLPLWVDDYLAFQVHHPEPLEASGARTRLWCVAYHQRPAGTLPTDSEELRILAGATPEQWLTIEPYLSASWDRSRDGTRYRLRRICNELQRICREKTANTRAIRERWRREKEQQQKKLDTSVPDPYRFRSTSPSPSPSPAPLKKEEEGNAVSPPRRARARTPAAPKPSVPPAIEAYRRSTERYPKKSLWTGIVQAVGEDPEKLQAWEAITLEWIARGFKPTNVQGMLECLAAGGIKPGGNGRGGQSPNEPKGYAGIREALAEHRRSVDGEVR